MSNMRKILIVLGLVKLGLTADYNFNCDKGPNKWSTLFPDYCAGRKQSPINFDVRSLAGDFKGALMYQNYDTSACSMKVMNKAGKTLQFEIVEGSCPTPTIKGRRLTNRYNFLQGHLHWGSTECTGSEHTINSVQYSAELHLVHWNAKYKDVATALTKSDGLAVLGFLLQEDSSAADNANYDPLLSSASSLVSPDAELTKTGISLNSLAADLNKEGEYYFYKGGLTTPTCNEIVLWTVFPTIINLSSAQLGLLRGMMDTSGNPLVNNFRPVQSINRRAISKRVPFALLDLIFDIMYMIFYTIFGQGSA